MKKRQEFLKEFSSRSKNCSKWSKIIKNGLKSVLKCPKSLRMVQNRFTIAQKASTELQIKSQKLQNGQERAKKQFLNDFWLPSSSPI